MKGLIFSPKEIIKVVSNYFHLTALQVINGFFYILIYPFVIGNVGVESYGSFVFASGVAALFSVLVSFGFELHAAKLVAVDQNNKYEHSLVLSKVTAAKLFLELVALIVFGVLVVTTVPSANSSLYWACFATTLSSVFLPSWFFHGLQKVYILTVIQLSVKLISLPAILMTVTSPGDIVIYASLVSGANIIAAIISFYFAIKCFGLRLSLPNLSEIIDLFSKVQPFFWSTAVNALKQRGVELSIGLLFGMKEVAIYDLANKLFTIASVFASNVNAALFPRVLRGASEAALRKIFIYELWLSVFFIASLVFVNSIIISLFFEEEMAPAYGISVILSLNIVAYLIVGCYMYFVFIPSERYDLVIKNQIVGASCFVLLSGIFLAFDWSVYAIVFSLVISGLSEILFCWIVLRQIKKSASIDWVE